MMNVVVLVAIYRHVCMYVREQTKSGVCSMRIRRWLESFAFAIERKKRSFGLGFMSVNGMVMLHRFEV